MLISNLLTKNKRKKQSERERDKKTSLFWGDGQRQCVSVYSSKEIKF